MSLIALFETPFLNKTSLSKSFCLLRSDFQRVIFNVSMFFPALAFYGAFEIIVHLKQWSIFFQISSDGSELSVGLC